MKVVILCGGMGTRLREETEYRPKPMVPIGGRPILWHIMKHYAFYGFKEFVCALGYKGESIKSYFHQYYALEKDVTIDLATGEVTARSTAREDWRVHLIDTGLKTNTGGRIRRLREHFEEEPFLLAYGDSVSDVDLNALVAFHQASGKTVTLTAVRSPARFGEVTLDSEYVRLFDEKPEHGGGWINGGFMVVEPDFYEYLESDATGLEVLRQVALDGRLTAYRHPGYWQCMDNIRDRMLLESQWESGEAPWKIWE